MSARTDLRESFAISLPILQAPMAGAQGSAMAIAVCKAGGLGALPCAMLDAETMRKEVAAIRSQTDRPFNLNFFCHTPPEIDSEQEAIWRKTLSPYYEEFGIDPGSVSAGPGRKPFDAASADLVEELRPKVVSFHFGLPAKPLLEKVRATGAKIISSATTIEEAIWLEANGVDAVIAQGLEAGGHRGMFLTEDLSTQVGTFALVRQIVESVKIPVIASGGIADSKGVRAALELGAIAAQIGTAYLLCSESTISAVHRSALTNPSARHTVLTRLFSGRPARGIVNRLIRELGPMSEKPPAFPLASSAIATLRAKAESRGLSDFSPLWSGQNPSGCRPVSAEELTRMLAAENR